MAAATQYQVKVNGGLQFSSANQDLSKNHFNKVKKLYPTKHITFEEVKELERYNPLKQSNN